MTNSNRKGRALEYCFCAELEEFCKRAHIHFEASGYSKKANERDKKHFEMLGEPDQKDFKIFSKKSVEWIEKEAQLGKTKRLVLERLSDESGVKGDVTDIILGISYSGPGKREMRVSIKNNSDSLKHLRVPRIPSHCGITDNAILRDYAERRERIWGEFISKGKALKKDAVKFSELKLLDKQFVEQNLYAPLNKLVMGFLEKNANTPTGAEKLFNFLTGTDIGFYAFKNGKKSVTVKRFFGIAPPRSFTMKALRPTTFLITFSNGWKISMRIHTASERMYKKSGEINKSTKYDVLCRNLKEVISMEELPKAA